MNSHRELFTVDDIAVCAYALSDDGVDAVRDYSDCIPEALNALYTIAEKLGIKIRFSTVSMLRNYVRSINQLREEDVEELIEIIRRVYSDREVKEKDFEKMLKIVFGMKINISNNKLDLMEIMFASLYALFINTLTNDEEDEQVVNIPQQSITIAENILA